MKEAVCCPATHPITMSCKQRVLCGFTRTVQARHYQQVLSG